MPIGWQTKTDKLQELIAEEQAKILQRRRSWQVQVAPSFSEQTIAPTWNTIPLTQQIPQNASLTEEEKTIYGYQPPQLPNMGKMIPNTYTPPHLPNMGKMMPNTYTPPHLPTDDEVQQFTTQPRTGVKATPSVAPEAPTKEWWEQPAQITAKVMGAVGQGVSKIPVLPQVLQFAAPAFEFIHEKLEKPFASIITSPFSPSLAWKSGESWLEHEKREYETWKAPTYVKGLAEFAMPLWWIPWLTWGKGVKATLIGQKLARGLKVPEVLSLPSKEVLNASYKQNWSRSLSHWAENKPVIGGVVKSVGGEAAFARNVGEVFPAMDIASRRLVVVNRAGANVPVTDVVRREIVNRAVLEDMRHGYKGLQLPRMQALAPRGDMVKALQIDDAGRVMTAIPKEGNKLGRGLSEVFENPDLYTYSSKQAESIVREGNKILTDIFELAGKEGVPVPKKPFLHRLVEGKEVTIGDKTVYEASEYGSRFEKARHYLTMEEGINAGVKYGRDPLKSISATIDHYFKRIGGKRFDDEVGRLGMTIPEMVSLIEPNLIENMATLGTRLGSASYLVQTLKTLKSYLGDSIPGAIRSKIRRGMPEAMEKIEQAFALSPREASDLMSSLAKTIGKETKLNVRSLKILMGQFTHLPDTTTITNLIYKGNYEQGVQFLTRAGASNADITRFINAVSKSNYDEAIGMLKSKAVRIRASDIEDMVQSLNLTNATTNKAIKQAYQATYQSRKQLVDDTLKAVRQEADDIIKNTKAELAPLKVDYRRIALPYREGTGQIFGGLAKFRMHPAFRNRIFDADVVKMVEAAEGQRANQWVRNMAQASAVGRLAVAAMDFSAPFIQGLAVLGRNPVAWSRAVGQQFRFFIKPDDFFQYMMQPKVRALATERWAYGGSRSSFEFFEALAPLQRVAEKAPEVGAGLKRGIQETYGRAEVAFSGFGEAARNNMWEALRVKALQPDGTLNTAIAREVARSIDRMTGVMSTEALGIGRGQSDFESAFVLFAPRYTRAGMSYVADMMRGGIAGAEARKGLGSLMAAGMTYYYGVTTALGQQPNLDINSPRFMTVKIGDSYVGIGGILYSLARLGANVVGTAAIPEMRADFLTLSRFDNPFVKFMFSRSSVVTGTIAGALEQKDFFGEPLEGIGDWGKFMAERVLPIAAQRTILEPEHRNPAVFVSELMGGRTFPKGAWELQEETKDRLAQTEHGVPYDQLDLLSKKRIDTHPEVTRFQEEIDQQTTRRGKALSVAFLERSRDLDDARFLHKEAVENLQRASEAGMITGFDFKEGVRQADIGYGATYEHINKNPRYADVMKKLEEPREVNREYRWELAYDEMIQATSGGMFEDQFGTFDFQAYSDFLDGLKLKYGEADYNRAIEMRNEKYSEYPSLFQELQQAKEVLKPYWAVVDQVVRLFGQRFAESSAGQSLISKRRKRMRLTNREVAQAYDRFFAQNR